MDVGRLLKCCRSWPGGFPSLAAALFILLLGTAGRAQTSRWPGSDPFELTDDAASAIHTAASKGDFAGLLIIATQRPELLNWHGAEYGSVPLRCALPGGAWAPRMVKELLVRGADPNACDFTGRTLLHWAQDEAVVRLLLEYGAARDARDAEGETPLHGAQAGKTRVLLAHGANPQLRDFEGRTPLFSAASSGDFETVKVLLAAGADVQAPDRDGCSPLHVALLAAATEEARDTRQAILRALIAAGARLDARDIGGATPLQEAKTVRDVALLLSLGADARASSRQGITLLHWRLGDAEITRLLLAAGADVNARDHRGRTPLLCWADGWSDEPETSSLAFLVERGADLAAVDRFGNTALHYAATRWVGDLACGRALVQARPRLAAQHNAGGASPGLVRAVCRLRDGDEAAWRAVVAAWLAATGETFDDTDRSFLRCLAALRNGEGAAAEMAIAACPAIARIRVSFDDPWGDLSLLHVACAVGEAGVAARLLAYGADLTAAARYERAPIHQAAAACHCNVLWVLLAHGDDPNRLTGSDEFRAEGSEGSTPLTVAASAWRQVSSERVTTTVDALLQAGARVDAADGTQRTALHHALDNHRWQAALRLLASGADPLRRNGFGATPLDRQAYSYYYAAPPPLFCWAADPNAPLIPDQFLALPPARQRDLHGDTLLHAAAGNGNVAMIEHLLAHGFQLEAQNLRGETPLHLAVWRDRPPRRDDDAPPARSEEARYVAVSLLLARGARVNALNDAHQTALHYCLSPDGKREGKLVALLLQHGADPTIRDLARDQTPVEIDHCADAGGFRLRYLSPSQPAVGNTQR